MSLAKIPILLLTAYHVDIGCTRAPTLPASQKELVPVTSWIEAVFVRLGFPALFYVLRVRTSRRQRKLACTNTVGSQPYAWIPAVAESVSILAAHNLLPPSLQSQLPRLLLASGSTFRITNIFLASAAATILATRLRLAAFRTLGAQFKFNLSLQNDHKLATSWPYSLVRHPSYTGGTIAVYALNVAYGASGGWLRGVVWPWLMHDASSVSRVAVGAMALGVAFVDLIVLFGTCRRVPEEDGMMRKQFGQEWERWAAKVPYKLIPGVY
jgi:protein-S-isoprenylcysteine O-methyltransferase Ste14